MSDPSDWGSIGGCLASATFLHSNAQFQLQEGWEGHCLPQRRVNGATGICSRRPGRIWHAGVAVIYDFLVLNSHHQEGIVFFPLASGVGSRSRPSLPPTRSVVAPWL